MSVSLENLANLKSGSYYLSDNGEVKKAGLWTKFKYTFNLGHSKQRAVNLVNEIKKSLFLSAGGNGNYTLDEKIREFNFDSGVKSSDIKSLLSTFKQANQSKILSNSVRIVASEYIKEKLKTLTKNRHIENTPELKDLFLKACKSVIDNPDVLDTKDGKVINKSAVYSKIEAKVNELENALSVIISNEDKNFKITGGYANYLEKALFNNEGELTNDYVDYVLSPQAALLETITDKLLVGNPEKLDLLNKNAEYLVSQVGIDPDLDNILFKQYSAIIQKSDHQPRSLDSVKNIIEGLKTNIQELYEVKDSYKRGYKNALYVFSQFEGKSIPEGIIPKMIELAKDVSLDSILSLGDKPSLTDLYKAFSYLQGKINDIYNQTGLNAIFTEPGEKVVLNKLISIFMLSSLSGEERTGIVYALNSANYFRFNTFCDDAYNNYDFPGSDVEKDLSREYLSKVQSTMNEFKSTLWALRLKDEPRNYNYSGDLDPENETDSIIGNVYDNTLKLLQKDFELYADKAIKDDFAHFLKPQIVKKMKEATKHTVFSGSFSAKAVFSNISAKATNGMVTISIIDNMKNHFNNADTQFKNDLGKVQIKLPGGKTLSSDYNTALNELSKFVFKSDKNYDELTDKQQNQIQIVCSVLNKQFVKNSFDGLKLSLDDKQNTAFFNIDNQNDVQNVEFSLDFDNNGNLIIQSDFNSEFSNIANKNGQVSITDKDLYFEHSNYISFGLDELERLAELDFKNAENEAMKSVLLDDDDNKVDRMLNAVDQQFGFKGECKTDFIVDNKKSAVNAPLAGDENMQEDDEEDDENIAEF